MTTVLLVIHLIVTLVLIGVVLIQRSEGGGLGIGTTGGMGSFMGGRGTTNLLTRTTAILATIFMVLSLALALLSRGTAGVGRSILDDPAAPAAALQPSTPSPVPPLGQSVPARPDIATTAPAAVTNDAAPAVAPALTTPAPAPATTTPAPTPVPSTPAPITPDAAPANR